MHYFPKYFSYNMYIVSDRVGAGYGLEAEEHENIVLNVCS